MKICDFTVPELNKCRLLANFTKEEAVLFDMRSQNIPLEECAERLNLSVSAVKHRSQKLNNKIKKVMNF